jgi:hypothetical protein
MDRNDAIDLLRAAGVEEDRIDEDAILIASVVGTIAIRAFVKVLAKRTVTDMGLDAECVGED